MAELIAAIAAPRTKHVASQTLRVQTNRDAIAPRDIADDQGEVFFTVFRVEIKLKFTVPGRNSGLHQVLDHGDRVLARCIVKAKQYNRKREFIVANGSLRRGGWGRFDPRAAVCLAAKIRGPPTGAQRKRARMSRIGASCRSMLRVSRNWTSALRRFWFGAETLKYRLSSR